MTAVAFVGDFPVTLDVIQGGVEASTAGLAQALTAVPDGLRVDVFALPKLNIAGDYDATVHGITVHYFKQPMKRQITSILCLPRILRRFRTANINVVHLHGTNIVTTVMAVMLKAMRVPCVLSVHGIVAKESRLRYQQAPSLANAIKVPYAAVSEWLTIRMADAIIVNTPYVQAYLGRGSDRRVHVIPQGIFLDDWRVPVAESRPWLSRHIVAVGTIARRKGHDRLIAAFDRVRRDGVAARLTIIGATIEPDYYQELRALVQRLGLENAVTIRCDLGREELQRIVKASRFFALHSQEESQGIALCEAMAAGLPVVSTTAGGIPDVVEHGVSGLLSPFDDIDAFARNLKRLLEDDALLATMSRSAIERANGFTWEATALRTQEIYTRLIDRP